MKLKLLLKTIVLTVLLIIAGKVGWGQITSTQSGLWNDATTWVGGVVPTSTDNVVIANGHTVKLNTNATVLNLTIGGGIDGALIFDNPIVVSGDVTTTTTISNVSSTSGIVAGSAIYGLGIPAGTTVVSTTANTIVLSAAATVATVGTNLIVNVTTSPTITGDISSGSATIANVSSTLGLVVGTNITGTGIPASATIQATTANTITLSANATAPGVGTILTVKNLVRNLAVTGNLTINSGGSFSVYPIVSTTGDVVLSSTTVSNVTSTTGIQVGMGISGTGIPTGAVVAGVGANTITLSTAATGAATATAIYVGYSSTQALTLGGELVNNGTLDLTMGSSFATCSTVFNKIGDQNYSGSGTVSRFRQIILSKSVKTNKVVCSTSFTNGGTSNFLSSGIGTWEQTAGTFTTTSSNTTGANTVLNFYGTSSLIEQGNLTIAGTMNVNTSGTLTIGLTDHKLDFATAGAVGNLLGGTININGKLAIASVATTTINNVNIVIDASTLLGSEYAFRYTTGTGTAQGLSFLGGTISIIHPIGQAGNGGAELAMSSTVGIIMSGNATFVLGSGATTKAGIGGYRINLSSANILNNLIINTGSTPVALQGGTTSYVIVKGNLELTSSGTLSSQFYSGTALTNSFRFNGTGSLIYNGSAAQTITDIEYPTSSTNRPLNVIINNSNGVTLHQSRTIDGSLTLTNGNFNIGANTLSLNGPAIAGTSTNLVTTSSSSLSFGGTAAGVSIPSSVSTIGNLNINNSNGVTLSGATTINGILTMTSGALIGTAPAYATGGTLHYNGASAQTTGIECVSSIPNLTINNSSGVLLASNLTLTGNLTLSSGKLDIGANNLTIGSTGSIIGFGSSKYIVTSGIGSLKLLVNGASTFPIGTATSYAPAAFTANTSNDVISIRVKSPITNATTNLNKSVNLEWVINEDTPGGNVGDATIQWNATDQGSSFVPTNPVNLAVWNGSSYDLVSTNSVTGTDPFVATLTCPSTFTNKPVVLVNGLSIEKAITAFDVTGQVGTTTINEVAKTITFVMPSTANLSTIQPTIAVSTNATVSPLSGATQAFVAGTPVNYTVTAENGTTQVYQVTAKLEASVSLSNNTKVYNGSNQAITVTTTPTGLAVVITYDGSATVPKNIGDYAVIATINDPGYIGTTTGTLSITKVDLPVTGLTASNKVYDGLTTTTLGGTAAVTALGSDVVTIGGTPVGVFADKNVGTAKVITVTGVSISGADAGNYNLIQQIGLTADITAASLPVTGLTSSNKVYDGLTTATLGGTAAVTALGSDVVTVGGTAAGVFADKNVGTAKAITITGVTISGADAGNYNLVQQAGLTADITKANLTVTGLTASNKVYDGLTTATLGGTAAVTALGSDVVTVGGTAAGVFADKNVGTTKAITVTGVTITGADAGNYNLVQQAGLTADITKKDLSVSGITASNKEYDGTIAATLGGTAAVTTIANDVVTLGGTAAGAFADKNVGTAKAITITGKTISGADAGNYNLIQQTGLTANITARPITITATSGQSKRFGETNPVYAYTITTGSLITGDVLTGALTRVAGETVGTYAIQIGTLTAGTNYNITFVAANFTITPGVGVDPNDLNKIKIYSDTKDIFVEIPALDGNAQLMVFNILGNQVLNIGSLSQGLNRIEGNFISGTYIVKMVVGKKVYTQKVVLRK